jgi:hypothetical protein
LIRYCQDRRFIRALRAERATPVDHAATKASRQEVGGKREASELVHNFVERIETFHNAVSVDLHLIAMHRVMTSLHLRKAVP